ncbi:hypothetical protein GGX14DRAFT_453946 [Mycena pura]|uniref:Transmembrane protein n=1 Tax=Mycena pura TaxID=153505 RepID=A0AAD6VE14_9AGAR|nr:hypothetical protein GGX14DRAFT_453946 [Mycena pura]
MQLPIRVLFNPAARVYTLRLLLSVDIACLVLIMSNDMPYDFVFLPLNLVIAFSVIIPLHHILVHVLSQWRIRIPAVVDLVLSAIEIVVLFVIIGNVIKSREYLEVFRVAFDAAEVALQVLLVALLVLLVLSAIFRLSTVLKCKEGLFRQRFLFFGGCTPAHPPYTLLSIFLNRSIARPLVRGESTVIILARAVILSCFAIGVPAFAIYSMIVLPSITLIYTQTMVMTDDVLQSWEPFNRTYIPYTSERSSTPLGAWTSSIQVHFSVPSEPGVQWQCEVVSLDPPLVISDPDPSVRCQPPATFSGDRWQSGLLVISIPITPEIGGGVYVRPRRGDDSVLSSWQWQPYNDAIALLPGSNLFGFLTWTERRVINSASWALSSSSHSIYIPEISSLQQNMSTTGLDPSIGRLTLAMDQDYPKQVLQDTVNVSLLSGISAFGGFWTFVNGTFALFFGANAIYFAFGRRPLSALGVVHLFQRRALVRQWHKDFPTLHTEGGLPGSESAGIVAFIRERLIDLGENPQHDQDDLQSTKEPESDRSIESVTRTLVETEEVIKVAEPKTPSRSRQSDYLLDAGYHLDGMDIPLMDVDLGLREESKV